MSGARVLRSLRASAFALLCLGAGSAQADILLLRDGRIVEGKRMERRATGVVIHFENGPVEVSDDLIEDVLIEGETEFVPRTEEEREKHAQGLVPFEGKWMKPAQRERALQKLLADKRASLQDALAHADWGNRYREETKHFRWDFTVPRHVWESYAAKADAYYESFCKDWKVSRDKRKPKLQINFFADRKEFNRTSGAKGGTLAYFMFLGDYDLCAYYDRTDPVFCEMVLYHELNHYLQKLVNESFSMPHWPGEAMAEYYGAAAFSPQTKKLEVGLVQEGRLLEVRQDILRGQRLTIRRVVTEAEYSDYTWGWTLVHFLMSRPKYQKGFRDYFVGLANAKGVRREDSGFGLKTVSGEESLRYLLECLGIKNDAALERLEAEWYEYIDKELVIDSHSGLEKAAIAAKGSGRPIQAKRLFEEALAAGEPSARALHHYAELLRGENPARAGELWTRAAALDPLTGRYWYELGRLKQSSDATEGARLVALGKELDPELGVLSFDFDF